jgi:hypothetical protein
MKIWYYFQNFEMNTNPLWKQKNLEMQQSSSIALWGGHRGIVSIDACMGVKQWVIVEIKFWFGNLKKKILHDHGAPYISTHQCVYMYQVHYLYFLNTLQLCAW